MQEEVENKTVNLAVKTTKVSLKLLIRALIAYKRKLENKQRLKQVAKNTHTKGKQSVKELIGQDQGVSSMEIGDSGIRDFKKLANKYGVDFAVRKDKSVDPPRYLVFVKAKDADVLDAITKEHMAKHMNQEKRPSVLKQLQKLKAVVASIPKKIREKKQERDL